MDDEQEREQFAALMNEARLKLLEAGHRGGRVRAASVRHAAPVLTKMGRRW